MTPMLSSALLRTQSDARLVALAREGHETAFEAMVERYRKPLHRYLRRMLPAVRVEDVLQQTFLGAWSSLRDGAEVRELRPWLYRIAHNAGVNALKRSGYDYEELKESLRGSDGPEGDFERRAVMRETLAAVAGLPERQRRALLETAVEGRSQAEVAREMGMSEGAFRQLVHRARTTLRAAATAVTPLPMAGWAAAAGSSDGPAGGLATRVAELTAGAGTAGVAATVAKTGAVVVAAGALATGPVGLAGGGSDPASGSRGGEAAGLTTTDPAGGFQGDRRGAGPAPPSSSGSSSDRRGSGREDRRARGSDDGGERDDRSGRRGGESGEDEGRRGRGGDDDTAGEDRSSGSGSGSSGSGGGEDSSGSSGSGSSGSGTSGSGTSGSGTSGSGSSGSGSSGSGTSGSGASGSGISGSGWSGSGSSGSGTSGSGSSGSGTSGSGTTGSGTSGSGTSGSDPDDG